jgi:hypothetical protein
MTWCWVGAALGPAEVAAGASGAGGGAPPRGRRELMPEDDVASMAGVDGMWQHSVRQMRSKRGSSSQNDVGHVQRDDLGQAVKVAGVGCSFRTSGLDDVERAQVVRRGPLSNALQAEGSMLLAMA